MRSPRALAVAALLVSSAAVASEPPAKFTKAPEARREGDKVRIDFAVSAPTDVTVWIEAPSTSSGQAVRIVRHIGAAKLGAKKVPEPFAPEKLEQSIVWDGKDDKGAPAPAGCRVKVALGLSPAFEEILGQDDQNLPWPVGLATDREGRLYVLGEMTGDPNHSVHMLVLDRSGKYQRSILPTPPDLAWERVEALGAIKLPDGGWLPRMFHPTGRCFFPLTGFPTQGNSSVANTQQVMAVSGKGVIYRFNKVYVMQQLSMMSADGGAPGKTAIGPVFSSIGPEPPMALALSPDEKWLYAGGTASPTEKNTWKSTSSHVVWRLALEPMGKPEPFIGELDKPGGGDAHLNSPKGVAVDAKGSLYVADSGNNRVAIFDPAGKKTGQVGVENPQLVAVNPKTGTLYVLSHLPKNRAHLSRFDGPAAAKPSAEMDIPHGCMPVMAADFSGERPVLWFGSDAAYGAPRLLRVEDGGAKFGDAVEVGKGGGIVNFGSLALDPDTEDLYVRQYGGGHGWALLERGTGKPGPAGFIKGKSFDNGSVMDVGPDGSLYHLGMTYWQGKDAKGPGTLVRTDRSGKVIGLPGDKLPHIAGLVSDNINSRGFCVGPDGSVYAVQYAKDNHGPAELRGFNPDGSPKKGDRGVLVTGLSADACSPQVDRAGRLYVADCARPADQVVPERFRDNRLLLAKEGDVHNGGRDFYPQTYGSILRFGREGGRLEKAAGAAQAGGGLPLVTPAEWNEKATFDYPGSRFARVAARGCDLVVPHIAPVVAEAGGPRIYCQCQHAQFRVDRFDRLFVPDAMSFEVRVHDSEGNVLTRFGSYGNADCKGPKSQKPKPEIPLAWGFSVMASDRFAYVGDNLNRRIVKVKLAYAEEKGCPVP